MHVFELDRLKCTTKTQPAELLALLLAPLEICSTVLVPSHKLWLPSESAFCVLHSAVAVLQWSFSGGRSTSACIFPRRPTNYLHEDVLHHRVNLRP
jgi:hypothetical protein